ncbi:MAG: hypothetical protein FJ088_13960 [Deltaproteobacteria bacterium]|nr:hypothetical protein [Deltaproteobacteria bacterium]
MIPKINFDEMDRCPACKRKCSFLFPDGKVLMAGGLAVCSKCGNGFLPRSMARLMYGHKDDVIITPGKPATDVVGRVVGQG